MGRPESWHGVRLFTVGHSTRSLDELAHLLSSFGVSLVVDIRTVPRSRRNPQYGADVLPSTLGQHKLKYVHLPELGGLRRARADSTNTAWRNASFRGYADYMTSADFETGLSKLRALAENETAALMCAEAVPWRCHRSLVADALTTRGAEVAHITGPSRAQAHRLTPFAHVEGIAVTYPGAPETKLKVRAPFHLEATVRMLQRRAHNRVDTWEDQKYRRVVVTDEGLGLIEVSNFGSIDRPDVRLAVLHSEPTLAPSVFVPHMRRLLGLDVKPVTLDLAPFNDGLDDARRNLGSVMAALRGMRPPRFAGLFETFLSVVPFQQVSLDSGVAIVNRLVERFGESLEHNDRKYYAFPRANIIAHAPVEALCETGLSRKKAETLQQTALAIASGELNEAMLVALPSDEASHELCQLPGIGPWSAAVVLLRGLGRLDVFPPGDSGAARGLNALTGSQSGPLAAQLVAQMRELRGYLYFCLLGSKLLASGLIHPYAAPARE